MARSRNIKPGFFLNDQLAECDPLARLLFAGLWCIADREGRLEDRPKRIKAEVLPYDNCDVDELLRQLADHDFIIRYEVDGNAYIQVTNFKKHQNPHVKEASSIIPPPPDNELASEMHHTSTVQEHEKNSSFPADSLNLIPDSNNIYTSEQSPDVSPDTRDEEEHEESDNQENQEGHKYNEDSCPFKAALYLRNRIRENNHRARVPNDKPEDKLMQKWAEEMDRLNRIGPPGGSQGYTWQEIRRLIDFSQEDDFWKGNILSAAKLRDKCINLENQMKRKLGREPPTDKKTADENPNFRQFKQRQYKEEDFEKLYEEL
jgi:hypothetical protein